MINFLFCVLISTVYCDDLVSVVVIYRHGDRTPVQPYPKDPYRNQSLWPVDFGELTNLGKMQHYLLGKWFRERYADFLPNKYSEKDFYMRSTDTDRTLMSAAANLAGLYPPIREQIWDPQIPWQPIPIHTVPETEDNVLGMKKTCPKYDLLIQELWQTEYFRNISKKNHDLYVYLTENSGTVIDSLEKLEYLYNTLFIEEKYNFTLPDWTKSVYPAVMRPWAALSFATPTFNKDLARLKSGTLLNEIIEYFYNSIKNETKIPKMMVYSAHDITISSVLNTLGVFQYHSPPYASSVLIELKKDTTTSSFYVNLLYKNTSQIQKMTIPGCPTFNCNIDQLVGVLAPILLTTKEWEVECQLPWFYEYRFNDVMIVIYASSVISFLLLALSVCLIYRGCKKVPKEGVTYTQLPVDEVA